MTTRSITCKWKLSERLWTKSTWLRSNNSSATIASMDYVTIAALNQVLCVWTICSSNKSASRLRGLFCAALDRPTICLLDPISCNLSSRCSLAVRLSCRVWASSFLFLFHKHDKDHDGALSPQELVDLFDGCPHSNPWGMDVLQSVTTNSKCWIDLAGFLCQWNMTAYLDTPAFWNISPTYMQSDQYPNYQNAHHRFNLHHFPFLQLFTSSNRTGKDWPWECPFTKRGSVAVYPRSLRA